MRGRRRRPGAAGSARPEAEAGATGSGGLLGWFRKHVVGSIIGAALVACLAAWSRGFFDAALTDIAPSGAETFCALREAVTNNWPFAEAPKSSDRFTILIATIDHDDADHTYTRAVARAFLNRDGIERIETCRVLRLSGVGREAGIKAVATARRWLQQRHADLLIGGELLKKDEAVNLWFVGNGSGQNFQASPFHLDANLLKDDFKQAASTQLLGIALAAVEPATEESGRYLVEILKPVTERLRHLLDDPAGFSKEQRAQLQHALGLGLSTVGEQSGDKRVLGDAVTAFRAVLTEWTRERAPRQWATAQNNLGGALLRLSERENGTARLEEAVVAFSEALTESTRERAPLDWAMTQTNLGTALLRVGERESGTARLEEAVAAYREALKEYTRDRAPLDWATTQNGLGVVLARLGIRASGTKQLEEAAAAFREALTERTRNRAPLDWAATQNNLGIVLVRLGMRESDPARLEEAVAAYREALKEYTRERVPLHWATTQNNLGNALASLGDLESGTARLEEAVAAYREALTEKTRDRVPLEWAQGQENLAIAFGVLATRTTGEARRAYLVDAIAAVDGALQVYREGKVAYYIEKAERLRAGILAEQVETQAP